MDFERRIRFAAVINTIGYEWLSEHPTATAGEYVEMMTMRIDRYFNPEFRESAKVLFGAIQMDIYREFQHVRQLPS